MYGYDTIQTNAADKDCTHTFATRALRTPTKIIIVSISAMCIHDRSIPPVKEALPAKTTLTNIATAPLRAMLESLVILATEVLL